MLTQSGVVANALLRGFYVRLADKNTDINKHFKIENNPSIMVMFHILTSWAGRIMEMRGDPKKNKQLQELAKSISNMLGKLQMYVDYHMGNTQTTRQFGRLREIIHDLESAIVAVGKASLPATAADMNQSLRTRFGMDFIHEDFDKTKVAWWVSEYSFFHDRNHIALSEILDSPEEEITEPDVPQDQPTRGSRQVIIATRPLVDPQTSVSTDDENNNFSLFNLSMTSEVSHETNKTETSSGSDGSNSTDGTYIPLDDSDINQSAFNNNVLQASSPQTRSNVNGSDSSLFEASFKIRAIKTPENMIITKTMGDSYTNVRNKLPDRKKRKKTKNVLDYIKEHESIESFEDFIHNKTNNETHKAGENALLDVWAVMIMDAKRAVHLKKLSAKWYKTYIELVRNDTNMILKGLEKIYLEEGS